jgi:methionine salvage enolase-phosphatase E1
VEKTPRIKNLFLCAQNGLKKLIETYKTCSIITITLNYYYAILTNHINETYNENMFIKDNLTCYYTQSVNDSFNKQWSEEKIKVVLDIIAFLVKNENPNNVKSLETIMDDIDKKTQNIVNEIF